jgi:hypothetical protein
MKIANGTGTCAEIPGHAAFLPYSQMIVTALTETCDYNKPRAASCKRKRREKHNYFLPARRKQHRMIQHPKAALSGSRYPVGNW